MKKLLQWYIQQTYRPSIFGLILNPYFLVRTSIYRAIQRNASALSGTLLDFGCGSKPYQHLFTSIDTYVGLDVQQSGHDHQLESVDVFYDGVTIPFENESYDSCFSSQVFEHVFDLPQSLRQIHRVLKPGGKCLFLVPFVWEEHEVPFDFGRYSSFGITDLLEKSGFTITSRQTDSHFAAVLVQLWCAYVHNITQTPNKYLNVILHLVLVFPFMIVGLALQAIAPRSRQLYFNNVILATKQ